MIMILWQAPLLSAHPTLVLQTGEQVEGQIIDFFATCMIKAAHELALHCQQRWVKNRDTMLYHLSGTFAPW